MALRLCPVSVVTGSSECDQWVGPVDVVTGACGQWSWIYCLPNNKVYILTPLVSVLLAGSFLLSVQFL